MNYGTKEVQQVPVGGRRGGGVQLRNAWSPDLWWRQEQLNSWRAWWGSPVRQGIEVRFHEAVEDAEPPDRARPVRSGALIVTAIVLRRWRRPALAPWSTNRSFHLQQASLVSSRRGWNKRPPHSRMFKDLISTGRKPRSLFKTP